jgi:hypothetical protein
MDEATKNAKQQLLRNYQDRLLALRQRQARLQARTPADVDDEIKMLEKSVADLKQELGDQDADQGASFVVQGPTPTAYGGDVKGENIIVGDVHGTGVIVGKSLKTMNYSAPTPATQNPLQPVEMIVNAVTDDRAAEVKRQYGILAGEVAKGAQADDQVLAGAINGLYRVAPEVGAPLVEAFGSPALRNIGSRATWMALGAIKPA